MPDQATYDGRQFQAACKASESASARGDGAEQLIREHYRHSFSVAEYDSLCEALLYLLPYAGETQRAKAMEILEP
jgi:hypothetical protein